MNTAAKDFQISFMTLVMFFCLPHCAWALNSVSLVTYFPAPQGQFDRMTLIPKTPPSTCKIGDIMVSSGSTYLMTCIDNGSGQGQWSHVGEVWTQNGNYIYPTSTSSNPNIKLAIGTSTPELKLTLDQDGGILAKGEFGAGHKINDQPLTFSSLFTQFLWYPRKAAFITGAIYHFSTGTNDINIGNYSLNFNDSIVSGTAAVSADANNILTGNYTTALAGGSELSGIYSTNVSVYSRGKDNASRSTVINSAYSYGDFSTSYGFCTAALGQGSTISGGYQNNAIWTLSNQCDKSASSTSLYFTISGGEQHFQPGNYSTISGGDSNTTKDYATVAGGFQNSATGDYSSVNGGRKNTSSGTYSMIGGGYNNLASGSLSSVAGGQSNLSTANKTTVLGGNSNSASAQSSVVTGGNNNTASGQYSVVAGGASNNAAGDYSFAAGYNMNLQQNNNKAHRSFVWGYSSSSYPVTSADSFIIAPGTTNPRLGIGNLAPSAILDILSGGSTTLLAVTNNPATPGDVFIVRYNSTYSDYFIGINNNNPQYPLDIYTYSATPVHNYLTVTGLWSTAPSSREYKFQIAPLKIDQAKEVFSKMQPVTYRYKINPAEHHVGFIAEDVPDLVGVENRKSVNELSVTAVLTEILKQQKEKLISEDKILDEIDLKLQKIEKSLGH